MKIRAKLTGASRNYKNGNYQVTLEIIEGNPEEIDNLFDKDLAVEIKQFRNKRSDKANRMLWACIGDIAGATGRKRWDVYLQLLKDYGQYTHLEVKKEALKLMKREWREIEELNDIVTVNEDGTVTETVEILAFFGSHLYDSREFATLLNGTLTDMKDLALDTPPTEEMRRAIEALEAEEKCKALYNQQRITGASNAEQ